MAFTWSDRWADGDNDLESKHAAYVSASQSYEPGDKDDNGNMAKLGQALLDAMNNVDTSNFRDKSDFQGYVMELNSAVDRFRSNFEKV